METNRIEFSGTIERWKSVTTKTGTSIATLFLRVGKDKFKIVAFKNGTDVHPFEILQAIAGDVLQWLHPIFKFLRNENG